MLLSSIFLKKRKNWQMITKYGAAKIIRVASSLQHVLSPVRRKTAAKIIANFDLDPEKYVYLRNRAVSSLEQHGPNLNWDGFQTQELIDHYSSFIGKRVSVDHIATEVIGTVLDSEFIPCPEIRATFGLPLMPYEPTLSCLSSMCKANKELFGKVLGFAQERNIVKGSDERLIIEGVARHILNSGWVENVWAVDREKAEEHTHGMVQAMLDGEITDSSMGASCEQSVCSVCGNIATGEKPEHEDFCDHIRLFKGSKIKLGSVDVIPFEINKVESFFEDAAILPFKWGGKAGGEGADPNAKLLEVFSSKEKPLDKMAATTKKSYVEMNMSPPSSTGTNPNLYQMIGDIPPKVEKNKEEFQQEKLDQIQEHTDEQSAPGDYPEGTIVSIYYEDQTVDAVVVDEYEDTLTVAIEEQDDPVEISRDDVIEILEKPEDLDYQNKMSMPDLHEMRPESRAASKDIKP